MLQSLQEWLNSKGNAVNSHKHHIYHSPLNKSESVVQQCSAKNERPVPSITATAVGCASKQTVSTSLSTAVGNRMPAYCKQASLNRATGIVHPRLNLEVDSPMPLMNGIGSSFSTSPVVIHQNAQQSKLQSPLLKPNVGCRPLLQTKPCEKFSSLYAAARAHFGPKSVPNHGCLPPTSKPYVGCRPVSSNMLCSNVNSATRSQFMPKNVPSSSRLCSPASTPVAAAQSVHGEIIDLTRSDQSTTTTTTCRFPISHSNTVGIDVKDRTMSSTPTCRAASESKRPRSSGVSVSTSSSAALSPYSRNLVPTPVKNEVTRSSGHRSEYADSNGATRHVDPVPRGSVPASRQSKVRGHVLIT